jgi:cell division protein FtsW
MSMVKKLPSTAPQLSGFPLDPLVFGIAVFLMFYGLVMVGSASLEIGVKTYGNPFFLLTRHSIYLLISGAAALITISVPIQSWQKYDAVLLAVSFFLLVAVLVPGIGKEVNGANRWVAFGPFSLQGSEFVKLFVMIYMAGYLVRRKDEIETSLSGFAKPLVVLTLIVLLLLGQPDFGAAIVIISAAIGMIFLAGVPYRFFLPLVALCVSSVALIATLQPYRLARLTAFADPWEHQFGSGYQLTQALIAFGRGEWVGLGLGNSIQKLFFLPEAHTDFLFSIVAEELGIIGAGLECSASSGTSVSCVPCLRVVPHYRHSGKRKSWGQPGYSAHQGFNSPLHELWGKQPDSQLHDGCGDSSY